MSAFLERIPLCHCVKICHFTSRSSHILIKNCEVISISDHAAVFAECSFGNQNTTSNSWRFHPFILADHNFISYFTEEFNSFMSINSASTEDPSLLRETAKAFPRGLIIAYTLSKRHRQAKQKEILKSKLRDAERLYIKKKQPLLRWRKFQYLDLL